jgi:phosphoesterase RecJ-like protein
VSPIAYPPPPELLRLLQQKDCFLLATHVNPDADGVGSMLGLAGALRRVGKTVCAVRHDEAPSTFTHLPGWEQTSGYDQCRGPFDAVILFDCHEIERIGPAARSLGGGETVVVIDHHLTEDGGGDGHLEWVEPRAAASAALVHSLLRTATGLSLDGDAATCLYAGLLTDTGGFRFSNTSAETLAVASDLVAHGADAAGLAEAFLHRRRPETLRLLSRVLDSFDYRCDGRVVLARMTQAMCEATGARMEDTEGFVNFATSAEGVELVALLKEETQNRWRISLRANDPHNVRRVAQVFDGGGHAKAAGCTIEAPLEEVERRLLDALIGELERE